MVVRKGLHTRTFAVRGEQIYNYCNYFGTHAGVYLNYNKDNRFRIFPIPRTRGCEDRAILNHSRPDSTLPYRMLRATKACIRVDETDLGHVYSVGRPTASSPRRSRQPAAERMRLQAIIFCRAPRSQARPKKLLVGATHFDEE